MRAIILATLLAACGDDSGPSMEDLTKLYEATNADRATCVSGEWGTSTDCASVCTPKPAEVKRPDGCYSTFIVEVEGVQGYCRGVDPVRVDWFPCDQ